MKQCLITFRSVTPAQRAESAVRRAGIPCDLRRTPRWMQEQGCGYSLWINRTDAVAAVMLLREGGVEFRKVYLQGEKNRVEELEL